jgi:hypothetical protein
VLRAAIVLHPPRELVRSCVESSTRTHAVATKSCVLQANPQRGACDAARRIDHRQRHVDG